MQFENLSTEVSLSVAHNIFLTEEQRYKVVSSEDVEIIGVSVPVWCVSKIALSGATVETDSPPTEVICKYRIKCDKNDKIVEINDDGYTIYLSSEKIRDKLKNVSDHGAASLHFTYHCEENINESLRRVSHFVSINDESVLEESLTTCY